MPDGSNFTHDDEDETDLLVCEECGQPDDELEDGLCRECSENCIDGSWSAMRRDYGTWSL